MNRYKLKCGGRKKAFLGADGAISAAATLAAAGITAAATNSAAKKQADAVIANAKTQQEAMLAQNQNANKLQEESIDFTKTQNEISRKQQEDIQTTLQMMAGQQNMGDIMERNKMQARNGGRPKRTKLKSAPFYGGAGQPFDVTDGGTMIPVQIYPEGILYEAYGNDHEHYHKTKSGKHKTGVGLKFKDGSELEVEGNQNSKQGEYLFTNPDGTDAVAISKHSIKGFNPAEAVNEGMHPSEAFVYQERIKNMYNIPDNGNKAKCGGRKKLKKLYGGYNVLMNTANTIQNDINNSNNVAVGTSYTTSPVERFKLKCGGRKKAAWGDWAGATYSSIGNLGAGIVGAIANNYAAKRISEANKEAAGILTAGYQGMKGIDLSMINKENFAPAQELAVTRLANTNVNPQLERIRRNANAETRAINNSTLSSAARQQRLAGTNDRMRQSMSEVYANKHNIDEQIKQENIGYINTAIQNNANREMQANQQYMASMLEGMKYNNEIENRKTLGIAQANADGTSNSAQVIANAQQQNGTLIGQAITNIGSAFGNSAAAIQKRNDDMKFNIGTLGNSEAAANVIAATGNTYGLDKQYGENLYNAVIKTNPSLAAKIADIFKLGKKNRIENKSIGVNLRTISTFPKVNTTIAGTIAPITH